MAVKAGERCLILSDKTQNIISGEIYTNLYWLSEVVLENPLIDGDFFNGSIRCMDGSVMMDAFIELSYNELRVEGYGDIELRIRYYSEDGIHYRLEECRMDNPETGKSTETQNMEFDVEIMYDGDETITQFVQTHVLNFGGIYTAVESERGDSLTFEKQAIGIKTLPKYIAPGYKAYTDDGIIEGTLGKVIEDKKDLRLIDSIMANVSSYQPETLSQLYYRYEEEVIPSITLLNTRKYNDLSSMFELTKLPIIDVSNFEFEGNALAELNQWTLSRLFANNNNLQRVIGFNDMIAKMKKVSNNDTKWITGDMFEGCTSFNDSETIRNIDTTVLTNLSFASCSSLDLDVSLWDKNKITNLYANGIKNLTGMANTQWPSLSTLNLGNSLFTEANFSNINMPVLTTFRQLFYICYNLITVNLNNFYAPQVEGFTNMFCSCPNLERVDMSSSENIYAIAYMNGFDQMFKDCSKLKSVNLRGINFTKKTSTARPTAGRMFSGCSSLQFCDLGSMDLSSLSTYTNMFASVPNDCLIIVKDSTQKTWLQSKFSNLTNIKTVAEYEG